MIWYISGAMPASANIHHRLIHGYVLIIPLFSWFLHGNTIFFFKLNGKVVKKVTVKCLALNEIFILPGYLYYPQGWKTITEEGTQRM